MRRLQQINLTDQELQAIALVAEQWGMTLEDAVSLLAKEGLSRRMTPRPHSALVIPFERARS